MGSQVQGLLLIKTKDEEEAKRVAFYLEPDTRPDFPEDVPESEESWIDVFEVMEYPDLIELVDDRYVAVGFYQGETNYSQEMEEFSEALVSEVGVISVVLCEFDSDHGNYIWYFKKDESKLLWTEEDKSPLIDTKLEKQLEGLYGEDRKKHIKVLQAISASNI